ncbi:MAG: hypothetical protein ABJD07_15955 [Gemmatimonadaceae bacterium]
MSDDAEARAKSAAFREALARARADFAGIDGVVSVGFGQKQTGGVYRDDVVISVMVRDKKPLDALAITERIPPTYEGYPTDVRAMQEGGLMACNNHASYATIQGGIQIVPTIHRDDAKFEAGTLGCIVRRRGDSGRENVLLLTCAHVLYVKGHQKGDVAYHPFAPSPKASIPGGGTSETLGRIEERKFQHNVLCTIAATGTTKLFHLDCATARINIDCKCIDDSTCTKDKLHYATSIIDLEVGGTDNTIADVRSVVDDDTIVGKTVYKVGRTTGKTAGIVRHISATLQIPSDPDDQNSPKVDALNLIEIDFDRSSTPDQTNCLHNARFVEVGDSGAIIVDDQRRAIGLVAIGPTAASNNMPPPRPYPTWGCHIVPVLDQLGVCIPTSGGTSHGSCAATDGSGVTIAAPGPPHARMADGPLGFASHGAVARAPRPVGFPDLKPTTDAQRARFLALRDELRTTAAGRELHDSFALVRREIGYLVRNVRPVKVAWHRNQGPAFLAHVLKHMRGDSDSLPLEVAGVSRATLLTRMGDMLAAHGSNPMREAIERHGDLLPLLSGATSIDDCLVYFRACS